MLKILVFNCGSSSQNYKLFALRDDGNLTPLCSGKAHRVGVTGTGTSFLEHRNGEGIRRVDAEIPDHTQAARLILDELEAKEIAFDVIGHRFVHGGTVFQRSVLLTDENYPQLQACSPLAPIHNPNSLRVIDVCRERYPCLPQYLTFDTAFHAGLPEWAYRYALPGVFSARFGLRRYGFHGLSYQYVSARTAEVMGIPAPDLTLIACHLGTGGSSVAAIQGGNSVDTSMGYSPLAGLVMSTRCGDVDPLLLTYLMRTQGLDAAELERVLNRESGLLGLSGVSADLRDLQEETRNKRASLAVAVYTDRLKKRIASYLTLLGGADALVFTDDIGYQNAELRAAVCGGLAWAGVGLDEKANRREGAGEIMDIGSPGSAVRIFAMPTDEERVIAEEGARLLGEVKHVGA